MNSIKISVNHKRKLAISMISPKSDIILKKDKLFYSSLCKAQKINIGETNKNICPIIEVQREYV
uniref:Uncharacterized protein n=1 Tax=Promethearchaeum syntrophicum TaxID=2594042 RepID=A0A5B9DHA5_9ARCH|nr:hypothetical protein DSAG12_03895 [Candidatus Prometheoarchaeum syntrophicum]